MPENGNFKKEKERKKGKNHGHTNKQHAIKMSDGLAAVILKTGKRNLFFFLTNSSPDISLVHLIN